jgi:hypothetical protein
MHLHCAKSNSTVGNRAFSWLVIILFYSNRIQPVNGGSSAFFSHTSRPRIVTVDLVSLASQKGEATNETKFMGVRRACF